ncbi:RHS repeat-associated core domain-containing protein [Streptomyces californicus]|uniref:RHS repeat-associated core domain-containing protein n=1 Tax=Streptomyces californicus TaxID=67351 RepID=UPI0037AE1FC3
MGASERAPQPYPFADGHQDPTGLYHFAARYYDPNLGRFTTPDPSGQEKNPYLYAEGDPVNKIGPTGLAFLDVLGPAGDLIQAGQHLAERDTKALWGDVAGAVTEGGVATYCASAVVAAPLTLGASLGFGRWLLRGLMGCQPDCPDSLQLVRPLSEGRSFRAMKGDMTCVRLEFRCNGSHC